MGGRAGGGAGLGSGTRSLDSASNRILDLVSRGSWEDLSSSEREKLLDAADKMADKLANSVEDYEKAGVMDSLRAYAGSGFKYINDAALGKSTGDADWDAELSGHIKNIDKAIGMRKLKKDIIVWRGSNTSETTSGRYVSVSLHASVSDRFRTDKNMHAFRIPKGTHFAYNNENFEYEVMLPRGFNLNKYKVK